MHLSLSSLSLSLLTALTITTIPTVFARPYFCPLAVDKSNLIQKPFCCEGFTKSPKTDLALMGVNCSDISEDFVWECPLGGTPKCCYEIGPEAICTTLVGEGVE